MTRRQFAFVLGTTAATAFAAADDPLVKGKQIVDDAIAALGGQKFLSVENRVESGRAYSFSQSQLSGLSVAKFYTRYVPVPAGQTDSFVGQQEYQGLSKEEAFYVLFRDEGGWEVTYRGPTRLEKDQVERHKDTVLHNFLYMAKQRLKEPGMIFEYKGGDVVENTPVEIVDIIDSKNRVVKVYFHPTTKLPVRQLYVWRDATRERMDEVTRFARYREVDGTQWPYQIDRERNGQKIYQMFADSVEINQDLPEDHFAIPTDSSRPFKPGKTDKKKR
jgi:hypothetical protein